MIDIERFILLEFRERQKKEFFPFLQYNENFMSIDINKKRLLICAEGFKNEIYMLARKNPNLILNYFKEWLYQEYPNKIHLFSNYHLSYYWFGGGSPKGEIKM